MLTNLATALPEDHYLPTRNAPLNYILGRGERGGLLMGHINSVHGGENVFKTHFCAEAIVDALALGWKVICFDREGRITAQRIRTLGGDPKAKGLQYIDNSIQFITIERVFKIASALIAEIRSQDVAVIVKKLKAKKPPAKLLELYTSALGFAKKPKAATLASALEKAQHLVQPEHRTKILWVLDSTTATPAMAEVAGDKIKTKDLDKIEALVRDGSVGSNAIGWQARAYSTELRRLSFLDDDICALFTAQERTKGIGTQYVRSDTADAAALKYNARNIWKFSRTSGGSIYAGAAGGLAFTGTQMDTVIGHRMVIRCNKNPVFSRFDVPWVVLGPGGTNQPHTLFEYMVQNEILKGDKGWYSGDWFEGRINRSQFVDMYVERLEGNRDAMLRHINAITGETYA